MKKPIISVIVPVYNIEKYLYTCLESILNQTFSNIEIICVNDGSTDKSRKILEIFANKDSRIKIVDKENGGLSSARNAGMKVATGEFYSFVDGDDWIENTMLEKLYNSVTSFNTDIAICGVHQFNETEQKIDDSNPYYTLDFFDWHLDNRDFSYKEVKPYLMDVCVMAWNKLYRKSFIDECNAWFPDGLIFEDGPFFFSIFFKTKRVSIVRDYLYFYRTNRKGSIIKKGGMQFLDIIDVTELMYNSIKDLPDYKDIQYVFFKKKVEDILSRFENLNFIYKYKFAKKLIKESSLVKEELFPPEIVHGKFRWNYFFFKSLIKGNILYYEFQKYRLKLMYKTMEILYYENDKFTLKYKEHKLQIKKRPWLFDIYYSEDKLYASILRKLKFKIPFKFSELEKFNEDD